MRRECTVRVHEDNDTAIIEILGDLSESAMKAMDVAQQEACSHNPRSIVVRFDGRSRLNSTGIAILINLVIDSRERGCKVYLTGMSRHFRKIFQMVGLTRYAETVESVNDIKAEEAD